MVDYPVLTKDQQKRFAEVLFECKAFPSYAKASRAVKNHKTAQELFIKGVGLWFMDSDMQKLSDLCDLYVVHDVPESSVFVESEQPSKRRGRGKASRPPKKVTSIAFDIDVYEDLERVALSEERTVGALVRLAVNFFLESRKKA